MFGRLELIRQQFAAVGLVAVAVYANTLWGDFTFDDQFAVVCCLLLDLYTLYSSTAQAQQQQLLSVQITNGDVTRDTPVRDLFKHDFWWVLPHNLDAS